MDTKIQTKDGKEKIKIGHHILALYKEQSLIQRS